MSTTEEKEVVASLEGMRITVDGGNCQLFEYDFKLNCWANLESAPLPLSEQQISRWLAGWNAFDRFKAANLLAQSSDYLGCAGTA
jgi:hypothetical protein